MGLHRGRCLVGNKRFFTCGTLETSEKSLDHEGRQDIAVLISVVTQRGVLVVGIAYGCPYYKDPAIFHLFLKYHK